GDAALADALTEWCLARLAYFKAPGWILFLDTLPTTGTQKVQKTRIFPAGERPDRLRAPAPHVGVGPLGREGARVVAARLDVGRGRLARAARDHGGRS